MSAEPRLVLDDHLLPTDCIICVLDDYNFLRRRHHYVQVSMRTPRHDFPSLRDNFTAFNACRCAVQLLSVGTLKSQALSVNIELVYQLIFRIELVQLLLGFSAFFRTTQFSGMGDALTDWNIS